MKIRRAGQGDYYDIYLLNKNGLGYDFELEKTKERLSFILKEQKDRIYIAEIDNAVVGYVHGQDYELTYMDSLKNILAIVVDENKRGYGIGRALLAAVENWAKETGAAGVRLVSGFNREEAHKFYLACGYIDRKNQKNFIKVF